MRKISLILVIALLLSIGGVYATWTYTQSTDVMDVRQASAVNLSGVTTIGTYGTYTINTDNLSMVVDPKSDTSHITALNITGYITITFTPNTHAPAEVKNNAVPSTYTISLSNDNWLYDERNIFTLQHTGAHDISWGSAGTDGVFTFTITADELAQHITMTEFLLDTKVKYDAFDLALEKGQIAIAVSDGQNSSTPAT